MDREELLQLYSEAVQVAGEFPLKGKTMPYTSANGYMFSLVNKDDQLGIRLSKEESAVFLKEYDSGEFKSHGAIMRDYVRIPEDLLSKTELIAKYLMKGYEHVMTLPPK